MLLCLSKKFTQLGQHAIVRQRREKAFFFIFCQEGAGCWEGHQCLLKAADFHMHVNEEEDYFKTIHVVPLP